jgi:hypothetical protein
MKGILCSVFLTALTVPALAQTASCQNHSCLVVLDTFLYHISLDSTPEQASAKEPLTGASAKSSLSVSCDPAGECLIVDSSGDGQFWRANISVPTNLQGPLKFN